MARGMRDAMGEQGSLGAGAQCPRVPVDIRHLAAYHEGAGDEELAIELTGLLAEGLDSAIAQNHVGAGRGRRH